MAAGSAYAGLLLFDGVSERRSRMTDASPAAGPVPPGREPPDPAAFEDVRCPACGADDAGPLVRAQDDLTGKPGGFTFVQCRPCGLAYQNPRIMERRIGAWYDDEYIAHRRKTDWGILTPLYR